MGGQRVRDCIRRPPAARRSHGRSLRPPAHVRHRSARLHGRFAGRGTCVDVRGAHRRPRSAGRRRRDRRADRFVAAGGDICRGAGAQPGARRLFGHLSRRRRARPSSRWRDHKLLLLALDPVRERPGGTRARIRRATRARREPRHPRAARFARRRGRHRGRDAARLRTFARLGARMERFHNARHAWRRARPPGAVRRCRSDQPATVDAADGLLQPQPHRRVRPLAGHRSGPVRDVVPSHALSAERPRPDTAAGRVCVPAHRSRSNRRRRSHITSHRPNRTARADDRRLADGGDRPVLAVVHYRPR